MLNGAAFAWFVKQRMMKKGIVASNGSTVIMSQISSGTSSGNSAIVLNIEKLAQFKADSERYEKGI